MALPFLTVGRTLIFALCAWNVIFLARASESYGFKKVGAWPGYARGTPKDLDIVDNTAYVAMGEGGICIIDITSRTNPSLLARLDLPGDALTVKVRDGFAYVPCGGDGLNIVNVTDSRSPTIVGNFKTDGPAVAVAVTPSIAFVADSVNGIVTLDVSSPQNPRLLGKVLLPGTTYDVMAETVFGTNVVTHVATTNRYMQAANGTNGVHFYRVSNPSAPQPTYQTFTRPGNSVRTLGRWGSNIYYMEGDWFGGVNFQTTQEIGDILNSVAGISPVTKLAIVDGSSQFVVPFYYFQGSNSFQATFRLGASAPPRQTTNSEVAAEIPGDGYSYFLDRNRGLAIYGASGLAGSLAIGGQASRVRIDGDRVYTGDDLEGIRVFTENSDGSVTPQSLYSIGPVTAFDVANSNLFLVASRTNVQILDVTNVTQPRLLTNISTLVTNKPTGLLATDIAVANGTVYFAGIFSALTSIDIRDPSQPKFIKAAQINRYTPYSMNIIGDKIFAAETAGFVSLQVNPDKSASVLQYIADSSNPRGLQVAGNLAFLCDRSNGLRIYDVSDPSNMRLLSTYDAAGEVANVAVSGSYAFIADKSDGIVALDISDPATPKLVANLLLDNSPFDIKVRNNRLYVAHGAEGLTVWDLVPKQSQTITFQPISDRTILAPAFSLSATASSGLSIQFSIVTGPATITNDILTITGIGTVKVRASQPGNDQYGAVLVEQSFNVTRAPQIITIAPIDSKTTRSEPFKITATASSGLPVSIVIEGPPNWMRIISAPPQMRAS